ncbi:Serine/threonine-protein kinase [Agyrium rufum]|nr:Serine/threonine-protein kinase [Agyrium rufum]
MAAPTQSASSSRRSREPVVGEVDIGHFRRKEEIGRGSFATVYKAVHLRKGGYVAIKSVNLAKLNHNRKLKDNLFGEINILKELHHPHIVALIDCLETSSYVHLVMEFCQLGDLSYFIKRRDTWAQKPYTADMMRKYPNPPAGGLNEIVVRHFLQQLSSALEFLRNCNLIHRDVKPQNLLLNPSPMFYAKTGQDMMPFKPTENSLIPVAGIESLPMLKIADFGFARSLPATSLAETLCGSPLYMAPEILRYEKYDATADLWSVGTVLFEMMVGKPPFRASNHVELLRKIEKGEDRIKFPDDVSVSTSMKALIRGLLRRNPVERMSFRAFFDNTVIKHEIPGLAQEDRRSQREENVPPERLPSSAARSSLTVERKGSEEQRSNTDHVTERSPSVQNTLDQRGQLVRKISVADGRTPPSRNRPDTINATRGVATGDGPNSPEVFHDAEERIPSGNRRPSIHSYPTAPARPDQPTVSARRDPRVIGLQRPSGLNPSSTATNVPMASPRQRQLSSRKSEDELSREVQEQRERALSDVAFEREYVLVDKKNVEVNALADELAANQGQKAPNATNLLSNAAERMTTPTSLASKEVTGRALQRPQHIRRTSNDRGLRSLQSPSVITRALEKASGRLVNFGVSPPFGFGKGPSPPQYSPFPSYPANQGSILTIDDGSRTNVPIDEDFKVLHVIEECATRSDVVFGFAEVKYKQLIPLAPSAQHGLGIRVQIPEEATGLEEDGGLTVDAIVTLAEEALVLYVKALSLLAKAMDVAGAWWSKKNRNELADEPTSPRSLPNMTPSSSVSYRFNSVVQWIRSRFNEVLEKAEFVRLSLLEAQKRLPPDHPSHPQNHPHTTYSSTGMAMSGDQVVVSPGVTAEKLMYNRALEMSRSAAVNELVGEDLRDCEVAYITAIRLLEAVLQTDDDLSSLNFTTANKDTVRSTTQEDDFDPVKSEDRESVKKMIHSIRTRLASLKKKLAVINRRNSSISTNAGNAIASSAPTKSPIPSGGTLGPHVATQDSH